MKQAILLRHGITEANRLHRYCGSTDLPLDDAALTAFLADKPDYPAPEGFQILTSGMLRTEQTLQAIYGSLPHRAEPAFREIDFGRFENRSYDELKEDPAYQAWLSGDNEQNVCPGGESGSQMARRVLQAWDSLTENTLLVAHGGVIAAIMAHLFPEEPKSRYQWQPQPFCGYRIRFTETGAEYSPIPRRDAE